MKLSELVVYRFRNHSRRSITLGHQTIISGQNGSGKTALLEAMYFVTNGLLPPGKTASELSQGFWSPFFVRAIFEDDNGLPHEFRVSADPVAKVVKYSIQGQEVTRAKFLASSPLRAVIFSPIEMNILYLGPALRRDFLDETLSLTFQEFPKLRKEYLQALKNRNALLKKISQNEAKKQDLDLWDPVLASRAAEYYEYRIKLLQFIEDRSALLSLLLDNKYRLHIEYLTKLDREDPEGSILRYLREKRDRDVILGHTYIGPHLDDFAVSVETGDILSRSETYLSRGENKSLLFAMKLLCVSFVEEHGGKKTILLLDDLLSELDERRISLAFESSARRQFVVASQEIPSFLEKKEGITIIPLSPWDITENR